MVDAFEETVFKHPAGVGEPEGDVRNFSTKRYLQQQYVLSIIADNGPCHVPLIWIAVCN